MFAFLPAIPIPANTSLLRQSFETLDGLWQALPFLTFLAGVVLGASVMYILMALRLWKVRQGLTKHNRAMAVSDLQ